MSLTSRKERFDEVTRALEALGDFRPVSRSDLPRWYELARRLEVMLVAEDGLSPEVPAFLWNYLADADIRLKDPEYADLQSRQLRLLVQYMKRGEMPSDFEIREFA